MGGKITSIHDPAVPATGRCYDCDRTLATQADYDRCPGGCMCERCTQLCWRRVDLECIGLSVDWRFRALKAEADLRDVQLERDHAQLEAERLRERLRELARSTAGSSP